MKYRRNLLALCIGCALIQAGDMIVVSFLPILLSELGTSGNASFWSGAVFSVGALTSAIMSPVWGSLSDRYGKRPMLIRAGAVLSISYALIAPLASPRKTRPEKSQADPGENPGKKSGLT